VESKNIYQRINAVMAEVAYVKKDTAVSGGGANYRAVTRDSVVSILRESIVQAGIVVQTSQIKGEWTVLRNVNATPTPIKMGLYSGFYMIEFINIDDPKDRTSITVEAHAQDNGDKATGKAMTYAEKTGLLKQFLLETGLNDEERPSEAIDNELGEKFIYLIETEQALALDEFMSGFGADDPIRKALFDFAPKGKKTEYTKAWGNLISEASQTYQECAFSLDEAVGDGSDVDKTTVSELWFDNTERYKRRVWGQLNTFTQEYLRGQSDR